MPYSAGTFSMIYDMTTEAGSPPIEIAKLTAQFTDIATGLSTCMLRDGTGLPTANQNFNTFTLTNIGAATTLTGITRVSELIDQDHVFYVDTGSANVYAITPSPAITAYEEGQRFVFRAANANSGASTLNVNALGAFAIQHNDGTALASGAIVAGGYYEVTYDANSAPDRWVLTSPPSEIPDSMLTSNAALLNRDPQTFSGVNTFSASDFNIAGATVRHHWNLTGAPSDQKNWLVTLDNTRLFVGTSSDASPNSLVDTGIVLTRSGTAITAVSISGVLTTPNASASEVGFKGIPDNAQAGNYTTVLADAGKAIVHASGAGAGDTYTIAANASVAYPLGTALTFINADSNSVSVAITSDTLTLAGTTSTGTRTLGQNGMATAVKVASTAWIIAGTGIS